MLGKTNCTRRLARLLVICGFSVLGACATSSVNTGSIGSAEGLAVKQLDGWVSDSLAPALVAELKNKPRFEGESIAIVKLDGAELDPAIDALTERVREDLEDNLIRAGGVSLIWQRPGSASAGCSTLDDAGFFIGLDTNAGAKEVAMRVRVLDRRDNSWVPQISYQYRGASDAGLQQLVNRVDADSSLQGTRLSPFNADENDLAAQRLTQQLGCTVKLSRRSATLAMKPLAESDADLKTLHQLVTNYLQRQPGISVTDNADKADYNVKMQRLKVDSSKSQLWLQAQTVNAEVPLEAVLVYLNDGPVLATTVAEPEPLPVSNTNAGNNTANGNITNDTGSANSLIEDFRAFTPADRSRCQSADPWVAGRVALADSASLPSGACFALRATLRKPAHIYLLHEAPDGGLTRLIPDNCELRNPQLKASNSEYWFPEINGGQILDLDKQTGLENFHLLAMEDDNSAVATRNALAGLPALASSCGVTKGIELRDIGAGGLRERVSRDRAGVQWEIRTLRHE